MENTIGQNIKKFRQAKGLSQDRLSKLADVSYNSIIKIENSRMGNPTITTLLKIARVLEVSINEFVGENKHPPTSNQSVMIL